MRAIQTIIAIALFLTVVMSAAAQSVPISIDDVEFDDIRLDTSGSTRLSVERGEEYEIRVQFTPFADTRNVQIRATIDGFEFSSIEDVQARTSPEDYQANITYYEDMKLRLPSDIDRDNYKLRITISDRDNGVLVAEYSLKVDVPRNSLRIDDVVLSPSNSIRAGSALLATVRVENKGERRQDDVRVTVSIPGLGVSATDYIEEIDDNDDEEETEEIFLRVPRCAKAGVYDVVVDVEYQKRREKVTQRKAITVIEDTSCEDTSSSPKTTITLGAQLQNVQPGQSAIFPVTVANTGRNSRTFSLNVQQAEWASISVSPTSTLVIPGGQTQTLFVNVLPNDDAPEGSHSLVATITAGDDFSQEVTFTTTIVDNKKSSVGVLEVVLIVLVVILVIVGLVLLIALTREKEDSAETYY